MADCALLYVIVWLEFLLMFNPNAVYTYQRRYYLQWRIARLIGICNHWVLCHTNLPQKISVGKAEGP